jgi:hypothetical protein
LDACHDRSAVGFRRGPQPYFIGLQAARHLKNVFQIGDEDRAVLRKKAGEIIKKTGRLKRHALPLPQIERQHNRVAGVE